MSARLDNPGEHSDEWVLYERGSMPVLDWGTRSSAGSRRLKLLTPLSSLLGLLMGLGLLARCWFLWASMTHCGRGLPPQGLMFVVKEDNAELAFFRKKTVPDVIDPALAELSRIQELLREGERGTLCPAHARSRSKAIADRLDNLMAVATLRQIPRRYASRYEVVLHCIAAASQARCVLERGLTSEIPQEERERDLQQVSELCRTAKRRLLALRAYFEAPRVPATPKSLPSEKKTQ